MPLFLPSLKDYSHCCEIKVADNVCFNRELLLFQKNRIFEDSFAWKEQVNQYKTLKRKLIFFVKNKFLRKKVFVDKTVWCLNNYSTGGYFHWLTEILPRMWAARNFLDDAVFPLPDYFISKWKFIEQTLPAFGRITILPLTNGFVYTSGSLILPTPTGGPLNYHPEPVKQVAETLKNHFYQPDFEGNYEKIYISRAGAKHRKIINEEELVSNLLSKGFVICHFEDIDFKSIVNIMSRARYVIGPHGAGLTNLIFQAPGSKILEIRTTRDISWLNCFFTLANVFNIRYYYFKGRPKEDKKLRPDDESLYINIPEFEEVLTEFLKN